MKATPINAMHHFLIHSFLVTAFVIAQTPGPTPFISNRTVAPTMIPIQTPEMMNTSAPSITAMPSMMSPTVKPFSTDTAPPVASEDVSVTIDTIQIKFSGASIIAASDILQFEATMDVWFETYFNQEIESSQRYLLLHHQRDLEQFRFPEVRNMDSAYTVVTQDTSTTKGSNIASFTQMLSYATASLEQGKPQGYAILPFADAAYKELLMKELVTNIDSMLELSAISTPVIIPPNTINDGSLSTGAIVGVAIAAICGLLLMAIVGYFIGKQKVDHVASFDTSSSKAKSTGEHGLRENMEHQNTKSTGQSPLILNPINVGSNESHQQVNPPVQRSDHVLYYKDQARTVICPIVEAIPDAKKETNDSSNIPFASLVPL